MTTALIRYEAARTALAEAHRIDEVKDIRDKAAALEAYARQKNDIEMERWVAEIKLRAFARIGEISKELETAHKVGQGSEVQLPTAGKLKSEVLKSAGISTSTAHRAEKLAENKEAVDAYIARKAEQRAPVKYAEALAAVQEQLGINQELKETMARMEGERSARCRAAEAWRPFEMALLHLSDRVAKASDTSMPGCPHDTAQLMLAQWRAISEFLSIHLEAVCTPTN